MQSIAYFLNTLRNRLAKTRHGGYLNGRKELEIIYKANWPVNGLTNDVSHLQGRNQSI